MYAAVSGLKSHMSKLNVIGNNIANVNTYGYKSGRAVFQTELYTTLQTGSNGTSTSGGKNPSQIGYGASLGSVDVDMSTGTYAATGKATDCMIDGDGFFLVGDKGLTFSSASDLKTLTLTRVGDFEIKADGYLTDSQGNVVYGFVTSGEDTNGNALFSNELQAICLPKLKSETTQDANGNDVTKYTFIYPGSDDYDSTDNADLPFAQLDSITIDGTTGKISGTSKDTDAIITVGYIAIGNVTNPNGVTQESGTYYKAGDGSGDLTITLLGGVASDLKDADGNTLQYIGGDDTKSGMQIYSAGTTALITGGLEASTTDLATEITEMITTQRGYQANTRIITVTDSMLEELVNMKR
jgi:flagellar hook protein FlgE